ncbi:hypothetical protein DPMN_067308 [Dreissena polymorpha]|uniref:HTH CENPB-type domain-containing protein n=1 Tax=Dreissena polymorpha TaxID=45954 RepID=A0A9D3YXR6_DREPO|nr:hypothetical protein DPMN_067308 [Dreissena polymorpha]
MWKYELGTVTDVADNTPTKGKWKTRVLKAVHSYWSDQIDSLTPLYSTLFFLRQDKYVPQYPDIDKSLMRWFEERRQQGVRVTGKKLKQEAFRFYSENGNQSFKASNGCGITLALDGIEDDLFQQSGYELLSEFKGFSDDDIEIAEKGCNLENVAGTTTGIELPESDDDTNYHYTSTNVDSDDH